MSITLVDTGAGTQYLDDTGAYSTPAGSGGAAPINPYTISGLLCSWTSPTTVQFSAGAVVNSANSAIITFASPQNVNFATVGPGGLDVAAVANTRYHFYALSNAAGTLSTIIASSAFTFGTINYTNLAAYVGGTIAYIPMGVPYRTSVNIPQFLVNGHAGFTPEVVFTDWDSSGSYDIVTSATNTSFTTVQLYTGTTTFVPETARWAIIQYDYRSTTGTGNLEFQIGGTANVQFGACLAAGGRASGIHKILITSAGAFKYRNPANTTVTLRCLGYCMSTS